MAIFMLLLLSGLAVLTMKYVRISAKHYADSYNLEQAQLFMDSVIETALLRIEGYRRNGNCLKNINLVSPDGKYEANVTIKRYFIYDSGRNDMAHCDIIQQIQTPQSNGYILMNIVVRSRDDAKILTPVRISKRTLQRP